MSAEQNEKNNKKTTMDKKEHEESDKCQKMKLAKEEDERLKGHNQNEWQ